MRALRLALWLGVLGCGRVASRSRETAERKPAISPDPSASRSPDELALARFEAARDRQLAALQRAMARDAGRVPEERAIYRARLEERWYVMATRWRLARTHGRIAIGDPDAPALDPEVLFIEGEFCRSPFSVASFLRTEEPSRVGFRMLMCATMDGARHEYPLLPRGQHLE